MFEAYHVAVRLRLIDHVSHGLTHISHRFAAVHGHAAALQRTLAQIRLTAITGFAIGATGIFGLMTLRGPYEAAKRFNDEVQRFSALGLGDAAEHHAVRFVRAMDEIGTSLTEKMALYRDAMTVFRGDEHHAEMVTPSLARMRFAMGALYGGEHGGHTQRNDRMFMDLLRVMELRGGLVSEREAREQMNYAFQVISTSGNRVNPQALLAFMQTAGVTGRSLSNEAFYYSLEPVIQEMGGPRAGTAWQTLARRLSLGQFVGSGGRLAGEEMLRLGLLDRSRVEFDNQGHFRRYKPGESPLAQQDLLLRDPFQWYHTVLAPAYARTGVDSEAEFFRTNSLIGGRTGSRMLDIWRIQENIIRRGITMSAGAENIDQAYQRALTGTVGGREIAMAMKWEDLMIRLGDAVLPMAIAGMETLIPLLESMERWVSANPALVRTLVTAFAALSAAMAIGGIVLLLSAAFRGLGLALGLLVGRSAIFAMVRALSMGLIPALVALAGVIGLPWLLIGGLIIGLTALGVWLYNNVEPFRNAVDGVIGALGRFFDFIASKNTTQADGRLMVAPAAGSIMLTSGLFDAEGRVTEFGRAAVAGYMADGSIPEAVRAAWDARQEGRSQFVRPRAANQNAPRGDVYLDGRIVGDVVANDLTTRLRSPAVAAGRPDQGRAPAPAAMPYTPR